MLLSRLLGMKGIHNLLVIAATLGIGWVFVGEGNLIAAEKAAPTAAKVQGSGRLVINRAPNLGPTIVGLKIDGREVDKITYNRRYNAPISAGSHILTVWPVVSYEN